MGIYFPPPAGIAEEALFLLQHVLEYILLTLNTTIVGTLQPTWINFLFIHDNQHVQTYDTFSNLRLTLTLSRGFQNLVWLVLVVMSVHNLFKTILPSS